jgi:hypothetical protein
MGAFITGVAIAIVTFVLTGLVGNFLVQKWQQRNWLTQHRLIGAEKQLKELQAVFDEIVSLGAARNFRLRRVVRHKLGGEPSLSEVRRQYDESVVKWNDRLTSFSTRLTWYAGYSQFAEVLEGNVQEAFVAMGEKLEMAVTHLVKHEPIPARLKQQLEGMSNAMSGRLFNFSRDLLRLLIERQDEAYQGKKVPLARETLELFSTWQLCKALFKTPQASQTVR